MSIFKKASDGQETPNFILDAFFESKKTAGADDFASLIEEASKSSEIYHNRIKEAQKSSNSWEFTKPEVARYGEQAGGVRRVDYGEIYSDEYTKMSKEQNRTIIDNTRVAGNLSIWEPEFDEIQNAFMESQETEYDMKSRRSAAEKKADNHNSWEKSNLNDIRKTKVLPYRGIGISRIGNEMPSTHGRLNSRNEFIAETNDSVRELIKESNRDRKNKISRNGDNPEDMKNNFAIKEAIEERTTNSVRKTSFLSEFADTINLNGPEIQLKGG